MKRWMEKNGVIRMFSNRMDQGRVDRPVGDEHNKFHPETDHMENCALSKLGIS